MKKIFKDKNTLLIIAAVVLLILFIGVVFFGKFNSQETSVSSDKVDQEFLPTSKEDKTFADKAEAYKHDLEAEKQAKKELEDEVKGSDFYFEMQSSENKRMQEKIQRLQSDPYSEVMRNEQLETGKRGSNNAFANRMRNQLADIEDQEEFDQIMRDAAKNARIRKEMEKSEKRQKEMYDKYYGKPDNKQETSQSVFPKVNESIEELEQPIFIVENGKRQRRPLLNAPDKKNLVKAAIYGDQTIVSGTPVKMRLLEPLFIDGYSIPANTIFSGTAALGSSRLKITVDNFRYGSFMSPVSFIIYDTDAIEGLNLPNNMKAESARKMEQGLLQGVQLPISSIGTVTSEVTSAITATTQVAKQLLNQSLSQVKVHLKANYQLFLKKETQDDKRKREAEALELERLYKQMELQKNEPMKKNPLTSLIESM